MFYLVYRFCFISCYTWVTNCRGASQTGGNILSKIPWEGATCKMQSKQVRKRSSLCLTSSWMYKFTWLLICEILGFSNLYPAAFPLQGKSHIGHGQLLPSPTSHTFQEPLAPSSSWKGQRKAKQLCSAQALPWCSDTTSPQALISLHGLNQVNVSQAHTWIFLLAKMWQKPRTWGSPKTARAVCVIETGGRGLYGQVLPKLSGQPS